MSLNPHRSPYVRARKEINLRQEFYNLLYGSAEEIAKGRTGLLRKTRRDSDGEPVRCECRDSVTDEPDKDFYCRGCLGWGWYWDETVITYFRNDASFRKTEGIYKEFEGDILYVEYDVEVTPEDYIITVSLDSDGSVIIPVERNVYFKILSADPFRSDSGRIEFYAIRAIEERKWSTHYGVKNRQYD